MSAIIPCIFGTTRGFEIIELAPLPFKMKDLLVAITHGEVELALEDSCVKLLRIKAGTEVYTWIGLYRKAYEMGFSREGGYYGAGVWLSDTTVNARHVLDALEDLTQQIRRLAIDDRKFQRTLADIVQKLVPSPALSALLGSKAPYVKGGISPEAKNCAFIAQPHAARDIVNWAQNDALAQNFQAIIVAPASAFPKAGASGNITQYADIPTLERALERDYAARLTKLDLQVKDLHKRNQTLEAEAIQRNSEIQQFKQRSSQVETEIARSRTLAKSASVDLASDEDYFLSENTAKLILFTLAALSFLGCLALGGLYYYSGSKISELQTQIHSLEKQVESKDGKIAETAKLLDLARKELDEIKSKEVVGDQVYGGPTVDSGSNPSSDSAAASGTGQDFSAPDPSVPATRCSRHGCASTPSGGYTELDTQQIKEKTQDQNTVEEPAWGPKSRKILQIIDSQSPAVNSKFVISGVNKAETNGILANLEQFGMIAKASDIKGEERWFITGKGKDLLKTKSK